MPSPESLSASGRYVEIDLGATPPPLMFTTPFSAAYPADASLAVQALSRTIVATGGSGTLTVLDSTNQQRALTFAAGEANAIQAVGIQATAGVTRVKVLL